MNLPQRLRNLHIESLENRLTMAGNVTVSRSGNALTITGDDLANNITITSTNNTGGFKITGVSGTKINGSAASATYASINGNVTIKMNKGNDVVKASHLRIFQNLSIEGGVGQETITLEDTRIGSNLSIKTNLNNDVIKLQPTAVIPSGNFVAGGGVFVARDAIFDTGTQEGDLSLGLTRVYGNTTIIGEGGNDTYRFSEFAAFKDLTLTSYAGDDRVEFTGPVNYFSSGKTKIDTGDGEDTIVSIDNSPQYTTKLDFLDLTLLTGNQNDSIDLSASTQKFQSNTKIDTGAGDDEVTLADAQFHTLCRVLTGIGKDKVDIDISADDNFFVDLGADDDSLVSESFDIGNNLILVCGQGKDNVDLENTVVGNSFNLDLGSENDKVSIANSSLGSSADFNNIFIDLGLGDDSLVGDYIRAAGNVAITGNQGTDTFDFNTPTVAKKFTLDLGSENDTADIDDGTIYDLSVLGKAGDDKVSVSDTTVQNITQFDGGDGTLDDLAALDPSYNNVFTIAPELAGWESTD